MENTKYKGGITNLKGLKRYDLIDPMEGGAYMDESASGDFIRVDDVASLLAAPVAQSTAGAGTPRVDALMAKWDHDGATRGSAFCELRDLARELESSLAAPALNPSEVASVEDARDAARYRWLRDQNFYEQFGSFTPYVVQGQTMRVLEGAEVDTAVDAAMSTTQEGK